MKVPGLKASLILIVLALVASGILAAAFAGIPEIDASSTYAVRLFTDEGEELAEFYRERRYFVPHHKIPEQVKKAFIVIEDRRFYAHRGLDLKGIARALRRNIAAGAVVEGGSTITQQLAKMLLRDPERSLARKLKEIVVTGHLEWHYSKDEILGMYLNLAYFGERVYGIEAAARTYFNKKTEQLSVAEAALLAALQKAPSKYSPFRNPALAQQRRDLVLQALHTANLLSRDDYEKARGVPLPRRTVFERRYEAPYFTDLVRQQLSRRYGDALFTGGFHIQSTINSTLQSLAERAVRKGVRDIEMRSGRGVEAALVAIDMRTGAIKAMVGGVDYRRSQFNRATMALRQPGSAFKPFVYAAALEQGMSGSDRVLDLPVAVPDPEKGGLWTPRNHSWEYYGSVTLKTALSLSLNAATVRLAQDVGFERVLETALRCGIHSRLKPHPSIALGAHEVTLLDLTAAYIAFATGNRVTPRSYTVIIDRNENVIEEAFPSFEEVLSGNVVESIKTLLRAVVESGTAGEALAVNRTVYGKTGTTDDYSDAWFVGFDDRLAVGVWVGRDDHTPIGPGESGSSAALPIWVAFMRQAAHR
ncbi:MAG: PBP1A family penicillin-binding protein [Nitrospirota bacterium]